MTNVLFSRCYKLAYGILLTNFLCVAVFALKASDHSVKDPDYMNMNPHDAVKSWHYFQGTNVIETFRQYRKFIHAFAGKFPMDSVRRHAEQAAYRHDDSPEKTIKYFEFNPVLTAKGLIVYVRALLKTSQSDLIAETVRKYWLALTFTKSEIEELIKLIRSYITKQDYHDKLESLLSQEKQDLATDFIKYADTEHKDIAQARISIQKSGKDIEYAIKKGSNPDNVSSGFISSIKKDLDKYQNNHDVLLDIVRWYRRAYKTEKSIELLESLDPAVEAKMPLPWCNERNILARRMMEEKNWEQAYKVLAGHQTKKDEAFFNTEWMLGWIELTKIDKKEDAVKRFIELHGCVGMPISKSRMAFWAAEALVAIDERDRALEYYKKAAEFPGTFYGQLAVSKLKEIGDQENRLDLDKYKSVSNEAREKFNDCFIIKGLKAYGKKLPSDLQLTLLGYLSTQLTTPGEEILVTEFAYMLGGEHLAVFVAKKAQHLGTVITKHGYPTIGNSMRSDIFGRLPELIQCFAHGIIRQESNFSETAVSSAQARGLMQLIDSTASAMRRLASRYGFRNTSGNINDRKLNVTLGTTHLLEHLEKYHGYVVFAFAAYNAGDASVDKWLKIFGDPRETGDWMNWIESIPFAETRNYVQRVIENSAIYAALLIPNSAYEIQDWISKPVPYVKTKR